MNCFISFHMQWFHGNRIDIFLCYYKNKYYKNKNDFLF